MGRTIAIGDVHGCLAALDSLLAAIEPEPNDQIVMLGDYIDRGPDSKGVLDRLLELRERCRLIALLGNHELMLQGVLSHQMAAEFWLTCGGRETLDSYGGSIDQIPQEHRDFIDSCLPFYETPKYLFLHANYDPDAPADQQPADLAFWQHLGHYRPAPHYSGKIVIVGHTPQFTGEILDLGHVVCIDTFCFGSGFLTAYEPDTGEIWQARQTNR